MILTLAGLSEGTIEDSARRTRGIGADILIRPLATSAIGDQRYFRYAEKTGRPADELVQDAVAGYVDELAGSRDMLERRYDDVKSGKVKLIPGEEVFERLRQKSAALRQQKPGA